MQDKLDFKCVGDNFEQIPEEIIEDLRLKFPEIHNNSGDMVKLSIELKKHNRDGLCRLPFCVTVEAEALGGDIKLGDEKIGPRVNKYAFDNLEGLKNIKEIEFTKGRIHKVLAAVEELSSQGEITVLNVVGPMTIISSLMDPVVFYKGIRKNRKIIDDFIKVIENSIVEYIMEGFKSGASIISYGDPAGALDIVGPKIFSEISGKATYSILKTVKEKSNHGMIHICGKTSTALEKMGFVQSESTVYDNQLTYGAALIDLLEKSKELVFIGHRCIKTTPYKGGNCNMWNIKLS
ncbi:uroporphyrinogen decarboxylase family protein [Clostridium sp. CF012]|uniref:uroporphyrinogen decarboxylase family protein n=1 Tax=Clostridium sp. CF012 TaxID=2843319 RepID=UPI001C0CF685|nr:uroporphyrinogen decarboxylase family protein [Clostridium sp. CF012]MBU3142652.1 methylcobamide--CoM methyltransferase [Clostridium sp. CF012]